MPDRSLTYSRAGDPPCLPNQPGFIDLMKSSAPCGPSNPLTSNARRSSNSSVCASAAHDRSWRVLEGLRVGNATAVSREALIARLEQTAASGVFQWEGNRRARLVEDLDRLRRQLAARRVRIPAAADVRERLPEDLSAGIALRPENCGSHLAVPRTWRPGCSKSRRRWPTIGPPSAGPLRKTTRPPRGGKA